MTTLLIKVQNYFLPSGLNIVEKTRARVLLSMLLIIIILSMMMYPLTSVTKTEFPYHLLGLGTTVLLVILKFTQSVNLVGNLIVCLVFGSIISATMKSGGIFSHDLASLYLVLVCSVTILDLKYTYIYSFLIFLFFMYVFYISADKEQLEIFDHDRLQYTRSYYLFKGLIVALLPVLYLTVLSRLILQLIGNLTTANSELDESRGNLDEERIKLMKAKSELEKSNLKLERYAHTASHDLQQPIRTIISFTQLLSKKLQKLDIQDEKINEYLAQVVSGTKRMDAQVQDLLSFSKVSNQEEGHIYDMNEIVNDVISDLSTMINKSEAEIQVKKLPRVNVIKSNLSQVFQNLISNAIKYKKPDSKVKILIDSYEKDDYWITSVTDNGAGINGNDINKIFRLYTQLSKENEGLGIGLATCQQIIESYGGNIWVESELGKGSSFFFTLPKIIAEA